MINFWQNKITCIWQKVDIYFEMVQYGTMVPKKKGLVDSTLSHEVHPKVV